MCGIIGYVGERHTTDVLIEGLKALEYRGYDSAGVCISDGKEKEIIKAVGKVSELEKKVKQESKMVGHLGIAHTRWATNGCANLVNSHPHSVGSVTLVHNGIIENADLLREKLIEQGYSFQSETDSEVVAALLDYQLQKSKGILEAISLVTKELVGSYALVIMIDGEEKLYALRKDSPLIVGLGKKENFAASDMTAISSYVSDYFFLEEGEVAVITKEAVDLYQGLKKVEKKVQHYTTISNDSSKDSFEHYMLKEIMEEPVVLEKLIKKYQKNSSELDLSKYREIHIVACGSAMYAGLVGKNLIEEYADIKVEVEVASEYRYQKKIFLDQEHTLVILISQSGETADTIAALREAKKIGVDTLGIVNNPNSTIARECDRLILTDGGVEIAVATTKAYILQVCVLSMIAIVTGIEKNLVGKEEFISFDQVVPLLKKVLEEKEKYQELASQIYDIEECFFIGRGIDYAISMEGSLKLKEVSYINSQAYQAGELKHGTISLIEEGMVVFTIITDQDLKEKTISNLKETEARGARGVLITTADLDTETEGLKVVVPSSKKFIQPLLVVPSLQLLSYYIAKNRGCDIDKPRNLAKSVTVE